ncbi:hypothetical protein JW826_03075 [Candidatus Woesearchaeota archaeon]|nr:hypothetical protein [Candidatus Woesearchaeota archaeon]
MDEKKRGKLLALLSSFLLLSPWFLFTLLITGTILLLSGCEYRTQGYIDSVPQICGDGLCTREERTSCTVDCSNQVNSDQKPVELNWIEQKQIERREGIPTGAEDDPEKYDPVTPDPSTPTTGYGPIEQPLPEIGFLVASRYNLLSIGENMSAVMGTLTGASLREILQGGRLQTVTEAFGPKATFYEQHIRLRSGWVGFGFDEESETISSYLEYLEGDPILEYVLVMNCGILKFFEGEIIHFLGHDYVLAHVSNATMTLEGLTTGDSILLRNGHSAMVNGEEIPTNVLNVTFDYDKITVIVSAPEDIKMLPGQSLTDFLRRRVMLTNRIDLSYEGLTSGPASTIYVKRMGDDYKLFFQNNLGTNYSVPISRKNPFRSGNNEYGFIYQEGNGWNDYNIGKKDYFLINNRREDGGITTLLRLVDVEPENNLIQFQDPALETFQVYFGGTAGFQNATGDLMVYGVNHKVYVGPNKTISVDLNGDGAINRASIPIVSIGNSVVRLSETSDNITLRHVTLGRFRENSRSDLETRIVIDNGGIRVPEDSLGMDYDTKAKALVGMTDYGTLFVLQKDVEIEMQRGQELVINQPLSQRFANVILKAYE